jgi:non-homologous end joining protein Ku
MIDAKLKGVGVAMSETAEAPRSNVVDLMAALKRSLGQTEQSMAVASTPAPTAKAKTAKSSSAKTLRRRPS